MGLRQREPEARARYETGLLLWPVALTTLLSEGYGPKLLNKSSEVESELVLFWVCAPPWALLTLPPERSSTRARGARVCIWCGPRHVLGWYQHISSGFSLWICLLHEHQWMGCPHPVWMLFWVRASATSQSILPAAVPALALVWSCTTEREWPSRHSARAGAVFGAVKETSQDPGQFQSASSTFCFPARDLSFLCWIPGPGQCPLCGSNHSLPTSRSPNSYNPLPRVQGASAPDLISWLLFPSYLAPFGSFVQLWWLRVFVSLSLF